MALKTMPPRVARLGARIKRGSDEQGHDAGREFWRGWYKLARWERLRRGVFLRDSYTCQMADCGAVIAAPVCDHREPHRGDPVLFWTEGNLQTLCKPCHDGRKQASERKARASGRTIDGHMAVTGSLSRPAWFRKTYVPLTIVCGPPGSGKSTYIEHHRSMGDLVVCFDQISTELFGRHGPSRAGAALTVAQVSDVLSLRNRRLGDLMWAKARDKWTGAWLIVSEPVAEHRQWWATVLGARVIVLAIPADECRRRIEQDTLQGDQRGDPAIQSISTWWRDYRPAPCDVVITPPDQVGGP